LSSVSSRRTAAIDTIVVVRVRGGVAVLGRDCSSG
jgi:hypothetical protein